MIAPNTFVRVKNRRPPDNPYYDLGVVSAVNEGCAQVSFPGGYAEPWPLVMLEEVEDPVGIIPLTLLGPGGFYPSTAYWQSIWMKVRFP